MGQEEIQPTDEVGPDNVTKLSESQDGGDFTATEEEIIKIANDPHPNNYNIWNAEGEVDLNSLGYKKAAEKIIKIKKWNAEQTERKMQEPQEPPEKLAA